MSADDNDVAPVTAAVAQLFTVRIENHVAPNILAVSVPFHFRKGIVRLAARGKHKAHIAEHFPYAGGHGFPCVLMQAHHDFLKQKKRVRHLALGRLHF